MKTSTKGNDFPPKPIPDVDTYQSRNIIIADLGTQDKEFKGVKKKQREIWFCFELIGTAAIFNPEKGEQPFVVSQEYSNSLAEKANLRKMLQSWSGIKIEEMKSIDAEGNLDIIKAFGGKPCAINVIHVKSKDGIRTFANINTITPPIKALGPVAQSSNPLVVYDMDDAQTLHNFDKLPKFIQEKIKLSYEFRDIPVDDEFESTPPVEESPF
jgi:hypothetical protein